jgi:hypothetical protein
MAANEYLSASELTAIKELSWDGPCHPMFSDSLRFRVNWFDTNNDFHSQELMPEDAKALLIARPDLLAAAVLDTYERLDNHKML